MKVIATDNFDRDSVDDKPITVAGLSKAEATVIADALNESFSSNSASWFYKAVDDDHNLPPDRPLAGAVGAGGWVPVAERLPKHNEAALYPVWISDFGTDLAHWSGGYWWKGTSIPAVTHWMPVPLSAPPLPASAPGGGNEVQS